VTSDQPYAPENLALRSEIGADGFFAVDMRVGRVVEVQDFPEARKPAYKLAVDFGPVVGVLWTSAQMTHYTKEELQDRLVVGAINLGKKKIAGFASEFLILGSMDREGKAHLLQLESDVEPGAPIA
jgi:tRNA-binding protein